MRGYQRRLSFVLTLAVLGGAALAAALPPAATAVGHTDKHCKAPRQVKLQILAINDLHGALAQTLTIDDRPAGGAAILATYLKRRAAQAARGGAQTLRLAGGDCVGASPPVSALLQDEPTIRALDLMGFTASAVGNHELDEGLGELLRLQDGGAHPATGEFAGARMRYLTANVIHDDTLQPILKRFIVRRVSGVRIGIIGATVRDAPASLPAPMVQGLAFLNEAACVNAAVRTLRRQGIRTIIVLVHQGGAGSVDGTAPITGEIVPLVTALDDEVDVVVSGHTHEAYKGTIDGKLVTQARRSGTAFSDIDLVLDRRSGDVVSRRAQIVNTYADAPGIVPDQAVARLVARAEEQVAPIVNGHVATAAATLVRTPDEAGESPLGDLIADSMRRATGAQIAVTNPGGIRADLDAGEVTWGDLFTILPFGNYLVTVKLTGEQIERLLEQQWTDQPSLRVLQVSGLQYGWHVAASPGDRVSSADVIVEGAPLNAGTTYTVTTNSFLADGGDGYSVFTEGTDRVDAGLDLDALIAHLQALPQPFSPPAGGRITLLP